MDFHPSDPGPLGPSESRPPESLWASPGEGRADTENPLSNPYEAYPDESQREPLIVGRLAKRPRWWTPIAVVCATLAVFIVVSTVVVMLAFAWVHGSFSPATVTDPEAFAEVFQSRVGVVMLILIPQLCMILPTLVAAKLSPVETCQRLSLVRGHWPIWVWLAAAAATPLVGLVSSVAVGLFLEDSENLKQMSDAFRFHGQSGFLIPIALLIGATPAICEELVFRGYVQTRLTKSWGPFFGIFLSSFLFAAFHMDFVHIIAVFPLGVYLGWLSWRSGSLFPAMLAHFVNNVTSVVAVVLAPADQTEVLSAPGLTISLSIVGFGILGVTTVIMASIYYGRPTDLAAA
ncbi:CPBP family intramembrane glutamic endopeptidase [Novipirellula artificiosorum]|uniref:CAAX amino terminal protease self-immunity n=1 Tax=Novipirellula artificiosorum TaxID=2528016 RepID=A0A5C6DSZ6_9BACT|nr:CPBP family intramembrane glutamic endopeptidase [Novipirellula artificiosorum]TWU40453.1 CAAX amino terminal protease self- immunity [Novipirellula artificiosorum]